MGKGLLSGIILGALGAVALGLPGCTSDDGQQADTSPSCAPPVEKLKELLVVDPSVIDDSRGRNADNGVWSFRHAIEQMVPPGTESTFLAGWFQDWATRSQVNGYPLDRAGEERGAAIQRILVCPWLRRTESNGCDENCAVCTSRQFDLEQAPFRLVAIVNRMDLGDRPDTLTRAGEARLIFALTNGPADNPASPPMAMTLILEYALSTAQHTPKAWAEMWHALGRHAAFDEAYKAELATLTERFVTRNAFPGQPNGSALAQMRTNESTFNWIWQMREFKIDSVGQLRLTPVANTPGEKMNDTPQLRDYVLANATSIKEDKHVLPPSFLGGSADQFMYKWKVPGVDESTRLAFARGTCNGCHAGENPTIDAAFHVSPYAKGSAKLSTFLYTPNDPDRDELAKRVQKVQGILCGP